MKSLLLSLLFSGISFAEMASASTIPEYSGSNPAPSSARSSPALGDAETKTAQPFFPSLRKGYKPISPEDARKRIESGETIVLLDVRTPEEFAARRIPGSILIPVEPVDMVSTDVETAIPDKSVAVFIYCRSGRRSVDAARILVRAGYANVYDLGGINSWPYGITGTDTETALQKIHTPYASPGKENSG